MASKDIKIKVKGDTTDIDSSLDKTKNKVDKLGNASGLSKLTSAFKAIGAAAGAYIGIQAVKELVKFAGEIDTVKTAFKGLTSSITGGGSTLVSSMKTMSRGTISELDIMKSSNLALQLMGEDVAKMLPQMAEIATKTARAQGVEASQMLQDIVVASGRQSVQILDNLGISSVQAGKYMEEYAQSLGKTRDKLTDTEKSAAFFYATMKAGGELSKKSGDNALTFGESLQKLKASLTDFAMYVADKVTPALTSISNGIIYILEQANKLERELTKGNQTVERYVTAGKNIIEKSKFKYDDTWQFKEIDAAGNVVRMWTEAVDKVADAKKKISTPTSSSNIGAGKNPEAQKYQEAKVSMSEYYERLGQYQNAAIAKEFESYNAFIKTKEGKTAIAYDAAAVEEEFANRKLLAEVNGANQEVALKEQVIRAKLGLDSQAFQGAQMFANAGAQLMSSQNKKLFKLGQIASIANVWMNTAQAITKGYAQLGAFGGTAFAALMGTVGVVQSQNIMKQKPPGDLKNESANIPAPVVQAPKFAAGVFDIPRDTFAQLHAGETVIPKNFTESIKAGELSMGGGGITVNIFGDSYGYDDLMGKITTGLIDIEKRSGKQIFSQRVVD